MNVYMGFTRKDKELTMPCYLHSLHAILIFPLNFIPGFQMSRGSEAEIPFFFIHLHAPFAD